MYIHACTLEVSIVKWLSSLEMDPANRVQVMDKTDCISHSANILKKDIHPTILPLTMGKIVGQTGLFSLDIAAGLGEVKL